MDHEFSTSALAADQVGWDWFALQLDDGSELMVYGVRKQDGSIDPLASGTLIDRDGSARHLSQADFHVTVDATWKSPRSGAVYPSAWRISIPSGQIELQIMPRLADQELRVSFTYWEGAVMVTGSRAGKAVSGSGYVELTGYAGTLGGVQGLY
jgi:predicted secreted hydrolase